MKKNIHRISIFIVLFLSAMSLPSAHVSASEQDGTISHVVICWLKADVSAQDLDVLVRESKKLATIPGVMDLNVGKPISSERDIVDDSFTLALTMTFKNPQQMNAYLTHERHVKFVVTFLIPLAQRQVKQNTDITIYLIIRSSHIFR